LQEARDLKKATDRFNRHLRKPRLGANTILNYLWVQSRKLKECVSFGLLK
jgi:hypothetical protein